MRPGKKERRPEKKADALRSGMKLDTQVGQLGKLGVRQLLCIHGALTAAERLPPVASRLAAERLPYTWPRSGYQLTS